MTTEGERMDAEAYRLMQARELIRAAVEAGYLPVEALDE